MPSSGRESWYGPEDRWPSHPKPWFRDALEFARNRGWFYRKNTDHSFGTVFCPLPEDQGKPHKFVVFSTGRAGETAARELKRLVMECQHVSPQARASIASASMQLDQAERFITAARKLLDKADQVDQAGALWARAQELVDLAAIPLT